MAPRAWAKIEVSKGSIPTSIRLWPEYLVFMEWCIEHNHAVSRSHFFRIATDAWRKQKIAEGLKLPRIADKSTNG